MKSSLILGTVAALVAFAPAAAAKSPVEIEQIAKAVSVEMITGVGSGVIVHRQGNLYTVITNRHVVCGSGSCDASRLSNVYRLRTADGQVHQVPKSAVQLLKDAAGNSLDLASVQFRSSRSYQVAKVADPDSLKVDDAVYTAGFPKGQGFGFGSGEAKAVVNRRLKGDGGGYTVVYDAETLPGMSGGGAFDKNGRLVAVHGVGDRFTENTQAEVERSNISKAEVNSKIGINRGIPVRWVVQGLEEMGISVGNRRSLNQNGVVNPAGVATADEYFITGFNKLVEPGADFRSGRKEAVAQFSRAIRINPRYTTAYFMRAIVQNLLQAYPQALADYNKAISLNPKDAKAYNNRGNLKYERNDVQGALADYNKAISINPKLALAYNNRGNLKYQKLNDAQGALVDYNKAISINSKLALAYNNRGVLKDEKLNDAGALAYYNRGNLKDEKLNDAQGALADYKQSIALNPKYADAYINRGILKYMKLNNTPGAIADFRTAAKLARSQGQTEALQRSLEALRKLGATEKP
jgi:Tfp pilus assembly protein PilF